MGRARPKIPKYAKSDGRAPWAEPEPDPAVAVIVAGIDPGTVITGVCVVERTGQVLRPVLMEAIKPAGRLARPERLHRIFLRLREILSQHRPESVAIESAHVGPYASAAVPLGEARGAAILAALEVGATVVEYTASHARRAVAARGQAGKMEVRRAVTLLLGGRGSFWEALPLDVSDAAALAILRAGEAGPP